MGVPPGFVVVANSAAGSTAAPLVRDVAGRLGETAPSSITWTDDEESFDAAVGSLDGRRLVLVGGDGTLHFALNRLAALDRLDEAIGLVPAGTGNDFARGAGIPIDAADAVEVVLGGTARRFPVIDVDGSELAHNNAHAGLGLVAAERGTAWKPRLGRFAYPVATVVEGLTYDGVELTVSGPDGDLFSGVALAVLVLLGPSMGGGVEPLADVVLSDAVLDVVVIEPAAAWTRPALAVAALRDRLDARPGVTRHAVAEVSLAAPGALRCDVDGEIRAWSDPVRFRVDPRGWNVVAPVAP
jgi:YegS/Rv2252/BmrU family lipid kinase